MVMQGQTWTPVKYNQKLWFLHRHTFGYADKKPIGISDSILFGLLKLHVNQRTAAGKYRSQFSFGVETPGNYFRTRPGKYNTGNFTAHANFWFRELDSIGRGDWLVHTLDKDSLIFSTLWPASIVNRRRLSNRRILDIHFATRKIDTVINGTPDSALVYVVPTRFGPSKLVISKSYGLLQWREVQLWTTELMPMPYRKFKYDFMADWEPGAKRHFRVSGQPITAMTDTTWTTTHVFTNAITSNNTRTVDVVDSNFLKVRTQRGWEFYVSIEPKQLVAPREPEVFTVHAPDTMVQAPSLRIDDPYQDLYRTLIPADANKPWILLSMGTPRLNTQSYDSLDYVLFRSGILPEVHRVEGLDVSVSYTVTNITRSPIVGELLYAQTHNGTWGVPFRISTITSLADAQLQSRKLYPNPSTTSISLENASTIPASYSILDAMGRMVQQGNYEGNTISIENLPAGVYKLRMAGSSSTFVKQ